MNTRRKIQTESRRATDRKRLDFLNKIDRKLNEIMLRYCQNKLEKDWLADLLVKNYHQKFICKYEAKYIQKNRRRKSRSRSRDRRRKSRSRSRDR